MNIQSRDPISVTAVLGHFEVYLVLMTGPERLTKASDILCAGSVEISKTFSLTRDIRTANEHEVEVFPTPPLPPTKIHFNDF